MSSESVPQNGMDNLDFMPPPIEVSISELDNNTLEAKANEIIKKYSDTAEEKIPPKDREILQERVRRMNAIGLGGNTIN